MINPFHLQTFIDLCETRHFTKTAANLNMTQPGVSQHLKALENELGILLFHREGKGIELTSAGERVLKFALTRLDAEKNLRERLFEDTPNAGDIKISCSGSNAILLYSELLRLQEKHSNLRISLEAAPNTKSIEMIKQNQCDIALVSSLISEPELNVQKVGVEKLCLALPKGYPFNWDDLMQLGYINHPNGIHYATQIFEKNFANQFSGFKGVTQAGYVNQLSQILLPVSKGLGFTALPESTIDIFPDQELVEKAKLQIVCQETIYLVTKKYKTLPRRYVQVIELLEKLWNK